MSAIKYVFLKHYSREGEGGWAEQEAMWFSFFWTAQILDKPVDGDSKCDTRTL